MTRLWKDHWKERPPREEGQSGTTAVSPSASGDLSGVGPLMLA
jgi:hypothetical protein